MLPYLNEISTSRKLVQKFYGHNNAMYCPDGYFRSTLNTSSDDFPLLSSRKSFLWASNDFAIDSIAGKDKLALCGNENFYYNGQWISGVTSGKKRFVSMGAYLIIFPDKLCYNTYTGEVTHLESTSACNYISVEAETVEGDVSYTKEWVRVKKTGQPFSDNFKVGDGVELSYKIGEASYTVTSVISGFEWSGGLWCCDLTADPKDFESASEMTDIKLSRKVPDMDFVAECDNRLWGCSSEKHEIYCCKLGDPTNWNCFEGLSTDSYAVTVGSDGDFTGAVSYMGNILFFKEGCIHKVFGTKPSNFQVTETVCRGIKKGSSRSAAIVGEVLYYHSSEGIMAYGGSYPEKVSEELGDISYVNAAGGGYGEKYYVSMYREDSPSVQESYCYDTSRRIWHKLSLVGEISCYGATSTALYCTTNYRIYFLDGVAPDWKAPGNGGFNPENQLEWSIESGEIAIELPDKKHISRIQLKYSAKSCKISVGYENSGWVLVKSIEASGNMNPVTVPIIPRRCDKMRIKLEGKGEFHLYSLAYTVENNSEK